MLELVQQIGATAGVAAAVGLVGLSALYLSQARDVKRLREWAGRAPERSGQAVTIPPRRSEPRNRRIGTRHVAAVVVGLVVLGGAVVYGVTRLIGDDGRVDSGNPPARDDDRVREREAAVVTPAKVTVAVLNGTTVPGLAAALRDRIAAAGFKHGTINNFSDQQLAESVVQFAPGHEAEATAVGRTVGISRREPVTADGRALAPDAPVIVIAGADKAP